MAISLLLRVGSTSAQDINLTSFPGGRIMTRSYPTNTPPVNQAVLAGLGDGESLGVPSWGNVTETFQLLFVGTPTQIQADIQAMERILDKAREGTVGYLDERLYLLVRYDHDTEYWRSQILAASLQHDHLADQIWRGKVMADLIITRRYYFETETARTLTMTSATTTTPTAGYVAVYNSDDAHATQRNWFAIAASELSGSIPAPLKLSIKNQSGGNRGVNAMYIGNYTYAAPSTVDPIFRAEQQTGGTTSWGGSGETNIAYWSLADGNLTDSFRGQRGRVLVAWASRPDPDTLLRAALMYSQGLLPIGDLAEGKQILADSEFVNDLGSIPIPPNIGIEDMGGNMMLVVKAQAYPSGDSAAVDWVQVMPAGAGRYRKLVAAVPNWGVANGDEIVDDGLSGGVYARIGAVNVPTFAAFHEPIHVWPNRNNRLRLIVQGITSVESGHLWHVKAEYRPRRLTA